MVETLEEAKRRGAKDIPYLLPRIKNISYAPEWKKQFNYPLNEIPVADYYVEYEFSAGKSVYWLMEACDSHLHQNLKQLEESAIFFKTNNIQVDGYLIVIDNLSRNDNRRYDLKESTNKPLKEICDRSGYKETNARLQYKKPTFLIFRKDFKRLLK